MQNTVYYKGNLVSAQFSGHHQTSIPEPMQEIIQIIYKSWRKRSLPLYCRIKLMHFYGVSYSNVKEKISFTKVCR